MIPYGVVEFYGSLTGKFDGTGAGIVGTDWEKIYLCNGNNGTPDKRGRVPVGATTGMGGGSFNPAVDPGVAGNPSYALLGTAGSNTVTLSATEIPAHSHLATATVTDPGHLHTIAYAHGEADQNEPGTSGDLMDMNGIKSSSTSTNTAFTGVSVAVSVGSTGGGLAHANYQPGLGCYYIMYIP
jgi:microcystin-dependent protein